MDTIIYGGDTETYHGRPMTLQFYSAMAGVDEIIFVDESTATDKFFDWCDTLPARMQHVIYVHNLGFDLPEFLWSAKEALVEMTGGEFSMDWRDWHLHGVYGKPTFCRLRNERRKSQILIVDSVAWFQGTLAKAADLFCPDLPKLTMPKGLGTKKFKPKDTAFCEYAMRDAEVAYHIGVAVQAIHTEFDIKQAVSLADMSAKIFRHHFLDYTIPQPATDVIMAALQSYHGGKNNVVADAAPAWHLGVTGVDISSAYPYAMHNLPSFESKRGYKRMKKQKGAPAELPPWGVYQVTGTAHTCDWPVVFTHAFKKIQGDFSNTWIQGLELNEALAKDEIDIKTIRGFYYDPSRERQQPALQGFVNDFYGRKQSQSDPVLRYMYKTVLNALYGKFIQTRKSSRIIYTDVDANETVDTPQLVAGGMFHPFIASAITAHTRAYIHQIEHEHKAIHTATDGIYTYYKRVHHIPGHPRKGLGSLDNEGTGDLLLLRNKCYILYSDAGKIDSQYFENKKILKYAKHGFQGTVFDMERLVAHNKRKYTVNRPNRLRESVKRGLDVNKFVEREYILKVPPVRVAKGR